MKRLSLVLLSFFLFITLGFTQEIIVPKLTSPVMDTAKLLSQKERQILEDQIREIHSSNGPQIQILTVNDLQGFTIEEFSIRVAEKWQIGDKDLDNGIIITVAKDDRKVRIEVGNGIEGELTDFKSNKIIQKHMIPNFKKSNFGIGLQAAIDQITKIFNVNIKGEKIPKGRLANVDDKVLIFALIIFVIISSMLSLFMKNTVIRFFILLIIGFIIFFTLTKDLVVSLLFSAVFQFINEGKGSSRSRGSKGSRSSGGGFSGGGSSGSW